MAISRRLRYEILRRDNFTCRYCGASAPDTVLHVDHVIPVALGGGDEPNNLVTSCEECNAGKSSVNPDSQLVDEVDSFAWLFAQAVERATQIRRNQLGDLSRALEAFDDKWTSWTWGDPPKEVPRDQDWRTSVERFLSLGLTLEEVLLFLDKAMGGQAPVAKTWLSFCKRCWNEIRTRQEMARQLIEDGEV